MAATAWQCWTCCSALKAVRLCHSECKPVAIHLIWDLVFFSALAGKMLRSVLVLLSQLCFSWAVALLEGVISQAERKGKRAL